MGRHKDDDDDDGSKDGASYDNQSRRAGGDGDDDACRHHKNDEKKKVAQGHRSNDDDDDGDDKVVVDRQEKNQAADRKRSRISSKSGSSRREEVDDDSRRGRSRSRSRSRSRHGKKRRDDDKDTKKKKNKTKSSKKHHKKRKRQSYSSSSSSSSSSTSSSSSDIDDDDDGSDSGDDSRGRADHETKKSNKRRKKGEKASKAEARTTAGSSTAASTAAVATNERLLAKLAVRGETLEERKRRRAETSLQKRAAYISTRFGYTAEENPFHDPNLHQAFTWNKKKEQQQQQQQHQQQPFLAGSKNMDKLPNGSNEAEQMPKKGNSGSHNNDGLKTLEEIEKLRQRRKDRELQQEEMERIRREESRMKELENFDEWAKKEEHFHVQQQRQRSAIRLVDGREKPIDVLAKNVLLFGLSEEEKKHRAGGRASVKYQEKYDILKELENLEAELEEPQDFLKMLKLNELKQVLVDIDAFLTLERDAQSDYNNNNTITDEGSSTILNYWQALRVVALDEIQFLETGGKDGSHAKMVQEIQKIFHQDNADGQSHDDAQLEQMRRDVAEKLRSFSSNYANTQEDGGATTAVQDQKYWKDVQEQLEVHLAKTELSKLHSRMLVGQLERLEQKREQLAQVAAFKGKNANDDDGDQKLPTVAAAGMAQEEAGGQVDGDEPQQPRLPDNVTQGFGDLEEELGLTDEIVTSSQQQLPAYAWADRYRPRKPRYFNRVKTGYDWNKYNKTHYDRDNPPPKTVQGYKFNIFYPDLIDPSAGTPQFKLEPADSDEFCIIRFHAGPPYEDVAFKIINREWNRSRKHGFKCTFERGVLSLYFNFKNFWYRR